MPWLQNDDHTLVALEGTTVMPAGPEIYLEKESFERNTNVIIRKASNWPGVTVSIFVSRPTPYEGQKLDAMMALDIDDLARAYFAWPFDVVVDREGKTLGCLSSSAQNVEPLSALLSSEIFLPYDKRVCIAKNLCVALAVYHRQGLVFGNLTTDTVLVHPDTCRVFLDPKLNAQFISARGEMYPCRVGVSEYMAPETHQSLVRGSSFLGTEARGDSQGRRTGALLAFSVDTDLFALGVIVFALLNGARHPLSCMVDGKEGIPLLTEVDNSASGAPRALPLMAGESRPASSLGQSSSGIPHYCRLRYGGLTAESLFERCFGTGAALPQRRPSEWSWYAYLDMKSQGIRVRLARLLRTLSQRIKLPIVGTPPSVTDSYVREEIRRQYPVDVVGSESLSSPRVFWRTTGLFSVGFGLCSATCALGMQEPRLNSLALAIGSVFGMLIANVLGGSWRGAFGYKPAHYFASFACSFSLSLCAGILLGGAV